MFLGAAPLGNQSCPATTRYNRIFAWHRVRHALI